MTMPLTTKDIDGLIKMISETERFTSMIFDWVSPLGHQTLLEKLYSLQRTANEELQRLQDLETEAQEEAE